MESSCHIAAFGGGDVNGFSIAYKIVDLVSQAEYLVVVGAHALGHHFLVDTDHMPVAYLEFLHKEWKQW